MNQLNQFQELAIKNNISLLEKEFVRFLLQINESEDMSVLLAAASVMHAQHNGHICVELSNPQNDFLFDENLPELRWSTLIEDNVSQKLSLSPLVNDGTELKPLVFENGRLYLHKYWKYEEELAAWLGEKSKAVYKVESKVLNEVKNLFHDENSHEINWQMIAAYLSIYKDLLVITGGPGTGKTHTVLNIIAAQSILQSDNKLRVALAAPTGKAARRLTNAIEIGLENLPKNFRNRMDSPEKAQTVHKLLGADYGGHSFTYNAENKLPYDLIIIDEASMLDINMWVHLIRAIHDETKLVVLGDKDQLASVEAGSILGDICHDKAEYSVSAGRFIEEACHTSIPVNNEAESSMNDCIVFLTKSYRFDESSGIGRLAQAINNQDVDEALDVLKSPEYKDVKWLEANESNLERIKGEFGLQHYHHYMKEPQEDRIHASNQYKILCAVRKSRYGVERVNDHIEQLIKNDTGLLLSDEWYDGRIIMATKNDPVKKIRNGEIGICKFGKVPEVQFEGDGNRLVLAARLLNFESAYAITIHKSQGSEFKNVALVLPDRPSALLSKEILYTAVTRAQENTLVISDEVIIKHAINKSNYRKSGLSEKI